MDVDEMVERWYCTMEAGGLEIHRCDQCNDILETYEASDNDAPVFCSEYCKEKYRSHYVKPRSSLIQRD